MIGSKRIKIRIPKKVELSTHNFNESWAILEDTFDKVYEGNTQEVSFERTYRVIYELVRSKKEAELYDNIKDYLTRKLSSLKVLKLNNSDIKGWEFLETFAKFWEDQILCFRLIKDLAIYLDKVYCARNRVPQIVDVGLAIFESVVLTPLKDRINVAFIFGFNELRGNYNKDDERINLLKQIVSMMETILCEEDNFFVTHLQDIILSETDKYYSQVMKNSELSPVDSFKKIKDLTDFETSLDNKFLTSDTTTKIRSCMENALIWTNFETIFTPLLVKALTEFDEDLLREVYELSNSRKYKLEVKRVIQNTILDTLSLIKVDETQKKKSIMATNWVSEIIKVFDQYEKLLHNFTMEVDEVEETIDNNNINNNNSRTNSGNIYRGDENEFDPFEDDVTETRNRTKPVVDTASKQHSAITLLSNTFSIFFNNNGNQISQFICFYLDTCLKLTLDSSEIAKAMNNLTECTKLVKLLPEKDEFTMTYKNQLSKRLLQQRSSIVSERMMVKKISEELGSFFTYKLETMLRDISTSMDLGRNFTSNIIQDNEDMRHFEFVPEVLTITSWPFQNVDDIVVEDIILPKSLETVKTQFETSYNKKYNERTLKWAHGLGLIEIGYQFEKTYHELVMPIYSGMIFLLFKDHEELTAEIISEMTNIPEQELNRQLLSLTMATRSRILKKSSNSKTISKADKFSINHSFTSPLKRVKVQTIVGNISSLKSDGSNIDPLDRERLIVTNSAVVRAMKSEKNLTHKELFETVTDTLKPRFTLSSSLFKRSLGYLITKEYIRRDPDDLTLYRYIS